jgi:hypothetical protein
VDSRLAIVFSGSALFVPDYGVSGWRRPDDLTHEERHSV